MRPRYLSLALCALISAPAVFAQGGESTEILGVVQDASGALIPGVEKIGRAHV